MLKFLLLSLLVALAACESSDSDSSSSSGSSGSSSSEEDSNAIDALDDVVGGIRSAIYGGDFIKVSEANYIAQLVQDDWPICGGSIVSPSYVITAAHCIERPIKLKSYTVITGSTFRGRGGSEVKVKRIEVHEDYDPVSNHNDIAIIELASSLKFDLNRGKIALSKELPELNDKLTIVGFGKEGEKRDVSKILKSAVIKTASRSICSKYYKLIRPPTTITENQFCAGNGFPDTCQGDSGGPVVLNKNNALVGIVSYGLQCETTHVPGVYTLAPNYRPWIKKHSGLDL